MAIRPVAGFNTLVPEKHRKEGKIVDLGKSAESRQYKRLLSVSISQAQRLAQHGKVRENLGYDMSDGWLCEGPPTLVLGAPCQVVNDATAQLYAYIGNDADSGRRLLKRIGDVNPIREVEANEILPLPLEPVTQGTWALAIDLPAGYEALYGRRGMCTLWKKEECWGRQEDVFYVLFEHADHPTQRELVPVPMRKLVGLPSCNQTEASEPIISPFEHEASVRHPAPVNAPLADERFSTIPQEEEDDSASTHSETLASENEEEVDLDLETGEKPLQTNDGVIPAAEDCPGSSSDAQPPADLREQQSQDLVGNPPTKRRRLVGKQPCVQ
mmetsp:Transcript_4387/g.7543  ORF Transcript_4387/g.7543 Transcript_4387/m.7543 type:complete len:327 (+) Transcript_4387:69-1049(+)